MTMENDRAAEIDEMLWLKAAHEIGLCLQPARLEELSLRYPEMLHDPKALGSVADRRQILQGIRPVVEAALIEREKDEQQKRQEELSSWMQQGKQLIEVMEALKDKSAMELAEVRKRVRSVRAWERRRILAILLSIALSIGLAIGLFHWIFRLYATSPTSQLMVTYDIGTLAQSLLVGIAALIAAFTYASRRTTRDEPPL